MTGVTIPIIFLCCGRLPGDHEACLEELNEAATALNLSVSELSQQVAVKAAGRFLHLALVRPQPFRPPLFCAAGGCQAIMRRVWKN